jgi:hypothetical protein
MGVMPRRHPSRTPSRRAPDDIRPDGLGSHWRRDGTTKASYLSRGEALTVAEGRFHEAGVQLDVYRCRICSAWHLGNALEDA